MEVRARERDGTGKMGWAQGSELGPGRQGEETRERGERTKRWEGRDGAKCSWWDVEAARISRIVGQNRVKETQ